MNEVRYPRGSPRYTVRLSIEQHNRFQQFLHKTGRDASSAIRDALAQYLDREQTKQMKKGATQDD